MSNQSAEVGPPVCGSLARTLCALVHDCGLRGEQVDNTLGRVVGLHRREHLAWLAVRWREEGDIVDTIRGMGSLVAHPCYVH